MTIMRIVLAATSSLLSLRFSRAQDVFNITDLPACTITSIQMANLANSQNVDPCKLYALDPDFSTSPNAIVTLVQVTSTNCNQHRDGSVVAVGKLNADNLGRGYAIGFNKDFFVKFRLISVVAGNPAFLGDQVYSAKHVALLESLMQYTNGQYRYIIGTCSFYAALEKPIALKYETIMATQVGPPGFYNPAVNKWIFGFHVNSDLYVTASARKLAFWAKGQPGGLEKQPVRVIYRNASEFFLSTCTAAINTLKDLGFTDVGSVMYDPVGDDDGDGVENQIDTDFLVKVADKICPPGSAQIKDFRPSIYMCTLTEHDIILKRFRENTCLMTSMWLTSSTSAWATSDNNKKSVNLYQGGGQWHTKFKYSDKYFDSGSTMLKYGQGKVGYLGGYDMLVSYAIPILYAQHLESAYRVNDKPTPLQDFATAEGREQLRRRMIDIRVDTIFGTVQFDENQRNHGREAASIQWQIDPTAADGSFRDALFSPDDQAQADVILPAATAQGCQAGSFVNVSILANRTALLDNVCSLCPKDTNTPQSGSFLQCLACPSGTSTNGAAGASNCTRYNDNLLSEGTLIFGYIVLAIGWCMAMIFMAWIVVYRRDPVVRLAQIPFLFLLCFGGMVTSGAILALTFQAGTGQNSQAATAGCKAFPFLYFLGWIIEYGSLCAKTHRLQRVVGGNTLLKREKNTVWSSMHVIIIPFVIDLAFLISWTVVNPLVYKRREIGHTYDNGIVTIESVGQCRPQNASNSTNIFVFLGPIFANHLMLMAATHYMLWKVRDVSSRYQENKYMGMAAILALELLIVGIPILIAAKDSVEASFFVIVGIIGLDTVGVLGFVFIPKALYQAKGLEAGVSVGESILHSTHKKAVIREKSRQQSWQSSSLRSELRSSGSCVNDYRSKLESLPTINEAEFVSLEEKDVEQAPLAEDSVAPKSHRQEDNGAAEEPETTPLTSAPLSNSQLSSGSNGRLPNVELTTDSPTFH